MGFTLVNCPIATVLALAATQVIQLLNAAVRTPRLTASAGQRFITPWWADIALQGHYLGFMFGVVAGLFFASERGRRPDALKLFFAGLVVTVAESMWAIYWFRGNGHFVLFRAFGLALVLLLLVLIVIATSSSDGPLPFGGSKRAVLGRRSTGTLLLVALLVVTSLIAVPFNLLTVGGGLPEETTSLSVRDYRITYAEDVRNRLISTINVSAFGESTAVNTSGVIVVSEQRTIWRTVATKQEVAAKNTVRVPLGGLGWRETVVVNRSGWSMVQGPRVYKVFLRADGDRRLVYTSQTGRAEPVVNGYNVSIRPTEEAYDLVLRNETGIVATPRVPRENQTVTVGDVHFTRRNARLVATTDGTRVRVATASD
jgi:hypothetical protein